MQARLTDLAFGTTKSIDKPWFRIGRCKPYVDLCVVNIAVSRSHCEIFSKTGSWYLRDQNSTNSTYLNGTQLSPGKEYRLRHGDRIKLANAEYRFEEVL